MATAQERAAVLVTWLRTQVAQSGGAGLVVGLSGGVDSSVVAALAVRAFPQASLGLIMPCHSLAEDAAHARLAAAAFRLPFREIDLAPAYDALLAACTADDAEAAGAAKAGSPRALAAANLKPRLRMATLYHHANVRNYRVAGTGNRSELEMGYFTKYGDGGVDLLPLGGLVKGEVWALAEVLGVPRPIIDKPPSAGLWSGQTDEAEMGFSYADLDRYLREGEAPAELRERLEARRRASAHKRSLPPIAPA